MHKTISHFASIILLAALAACASGGPVGAGYYRVRRGDTLTAIAGRHHQSVGNLSRWNRLANPNSLEVGQVLRVAPPGRAGGAASESAQATTGPSPSSSPNRPPSVTPSLAPASSIALAWPANGIVIRGFNGVNSKGIDIAGNAGDPVRAAAAGTVVYAGSGLRGYGNLLIIKHNADFLTAYAHNRTLLVKEGEAVKQGQTIAEMGDSDTDRIMLHFELRYRGRSIDPARSLPAR
jgi:lipoprotein YgeR